MAWKFAYTDDSGGSHPEAYAEIQSFGFNVPNQTLTIGFSAWHDKAWKDAGKPAIAGFNVNLHIGANPIEILKPVVNPNTNEIVTPGQYLPSFKGLLEDAKFKALYDAVKLAAYGLSAQMPEFKGAESVE